MKTIKQQNLDSNRAKQLATVAAGIIVAGGVAYWFMRKTVWGKAALFKVSRFATQTLLKSEAPKHFGDGTRDAVDQAGWESFPASDPPAHNSFN